MLQRRTGGLFEAALRQSEKKALSSVFIAFQEAAYPECSESSSAFKGRPVVLYEKRSTKAAAERPEMAALSAQTAQTAGWTWSF